MYFCIILLFVLNFWIFHLIDNFIILVSFSYFICLWIFILYILTLFLQLECISELGVFIFIYTHAKYIDSFWFILGSLFIIILLLRLNILLYYNSLMFISFDVIKVVGFQWYWLFIVNNTAVSINIMLESDYYIGDLRLLQTINNVNLFSLTFYKFWISAYDVVHSFTVPSLGIKCDCIPGRCNEILVFALTQCTVYGQCSELCGILHGFMPIVITFL